MAKNPKNIPLADSETTDDLNASLTGADISSADSQLPDVGITPPDIASDEAESDEDSGESDEAESDDEIEALTATDHLKVVVCKGQTLYHNGEKYPASRQLILDALDAAPLLKRGVVMKHSELLKKASSDAG